MLRHEVNLIEDRLSRAKHPNKIFFSYANTVATIDFSKKFKESTDYELIGFSKEETLNLLQHKSLNAYLIAKISNVLLFKKLYN